MTTTSTQVLKSAKVGDRLVITRNGMTEVVTVLNRTSKRGKGGYVALSVQRANGLFDVLNSRTVTCTCRVEFFARPRRATRKASNSAYAAPKSAGSSYVPGGSRRPYSPPPSSNYSSAGSYSSPAPRIVIQTVPGVDSNAMLFFRYAALKQFPCSASELAAGRQKMIMALHPDRGGSQEEFVAAMRAYESLSKACR